MELRRKKTCVETNQPSNIGSIARRWGRMTWKTRELWGRKVRRKCRTNKMATIAQGHRKHLFPCIAGSSVTSQTTKAGKNVLLVGGARS